MHKPTNWKPAFYFFLFLSERYDWNNDPKKNQSDHNLSFFLNEKGRLSVFLRVRFKYEVDFSDRKPYNWAGHRRNAIFLIFFCRKHLTYIWNRILVVSLDGWRIGQWNLYRCSSWVFSIVHQIWPWSGTTIFIWRQCGKVGAFEFGGYISARSSRKKKKLRIFHILLFCHVQCCVRVNASNFQVLTRKSGGVRAFGNIVRFLAGPDRAGFPFGMCVTWNPGGDASWKETRR